MIQAPQGLEKLLSGSQPARILRVIFPSNDASPSKLLVNQLDASAGLTRIHQAWVLRKEHYDYAGAYGFKDRQEGDLLAAQREASLLPSRHCFNARRHVSSPLADTKRDALP
ncbi:hypothetical protein [Herbaspirillum sp. B65]|uniref:hypothetical protein n=1 Tax=Herbaspirillum sp. B65 TaxID=137708 RepID=UPI000A065807|nr:hypothetical protein [Herbaspirillum sp. B65]